MSETKNIVKVIKLTPHYFTSFMQKKRTNGKLIKLFFEVRKNFAENINPWFFV